MKSIFIFFIFLIISHVQVWAQGPDDDKCLFDGKSVLNECLKTTFSDLFSLLNETTVNKCIAEKSLWGNAGVKVPKCSDENDSISQSDYDRPTGGLFAVYVSDNNSFIFDLVTNYLKDNPVGTFNLVVAREDITDLSENKDLMKVLNNSRVNILPVETRPTVGKWMQDSFQFSTLNSKPAIYQLEHDAEKNLPLNMRLACTLSRQCKIPYFKPQGTKVVFDDGMDLNSGGNLEFIPGGSAIMGVIETETENRWNIPEGQTPPFKTYEQEKIIEKFLEKKETLLELDVSFLYVGHVDELVNFIKTKDEAPCDFVMLTASPKKGLELIEEEATRVITNPDICDKSNLYLIDIKRQAVTSVDAQIRDKDGNFVEDIYDRMTKFDELVNQIYNNRCISGMTPQEFIKSDTYKIAKKEAQLIEDIMKKNVDRIRKNLAEKTGCKEVKTIPAPVIFTNGKALNPNQVNGISEVNENGTTYLMPKSYVNAFEGHMIEELSNHGITTSLIHDLEYHLKDGEVHCGTNQALICAP